MEAARRESAMLMRVQLYPQFYVHLRSTFRGELGDLWLEMDRLPGSGLGMIPDCITLQSVLCSLLQVREGRNRFLITHRHFAICILKCSSFMAISSHRISFTIPQLRLPF